MGRADRRVLPDLLPRESSGKSVPRHGHKVQRARNGPLQRALPQVRSGACRSNLSLRDTPRMGEIVRVRHICETWLCRATHITRFAIVSLGWPCCTFLPTNKSSRHSPGHNSSNCLGSWFLNSNSPQSYNALAYVNHVTVNARSAKGQYKRPNPIANANVPTPRSSPSHEVTYIQLQDAKKFPGCQLKFG